MLLSFINEKVHAINSESKICKDTLMSFCKELINFYVESDWEPRLGNGSSKAYKSKRDYRFYLQRYVAVYFLFLILI